MTRVIPCRCASSFLTLTQSLLRQRSCSLDAGMLRFVALWKSKRPIPARTLARAPLTRCAGALSSNRPSLRGDFLGKRSFSSSTGRLQQTPQGSTTIISPSWSNLLTEDRTKISSIRKILHLARPERKPLLSAIGLLFVSSSVSLSIPFTIGKLIDFFASPQPVRLAYY